MNNCDCYKYDACDDSLEVTIEYQEPGYSAYQIALQNGFVGTEQEWLDSLKQPAVDAAEVALEAAETATQAADSATEAAVLANQQAANAQSAGNYATQAGQYAVAAGDAATEAAGDANSSAISATQAAEEATTAATSANQAAIEADQASTAANQAATTANTAADNATTAAQSANEAAEGVGQAIQDTENATQAAILATNGANQAATDANNAATSANQNAEEASNAATAANQAATAAVSSSEMANEAAQNAYEAALVANSARGWSPKLALVPDGSDREVQMLESWIGGTGTAPTEGVGQYISDDGFTSNISEARNLKGRPGNNGSNNNAYAYIPAGATTVTVASMTNKVAFMIDNTTGMPTFAKRVYFSSAGVADIGFVSSGMSVMLMGLGDNPVYLFEQNVAGQAGTFDRTLVQAEYINSMPENFKDRAAVLLVPGAWKNGLIYGMHPLTGAIIPFTFARSGPATYFDKDGIMQTAAAGVPRIDYDPVTKVIRGYLLENTAGNLATQSGFLNGLSDAPTNGGDIVASNTLWNKGALLEKGLTLSRSASLTTYAYKNFTFAINTQYTFSFFIKTSDGGIPVIGGSAPIGTTDVSIYIAGLVDPGTNIIQDLGTGVYRISSTLTTGSSISANRFGVIKYPTQNAKSYTITGFQLEQSSVSTSYIPTTTGQVTRVADALQSVGDIVNYPAASVFMNFEPMRSTVNLSVSYATRGLGGWFWASIAGFPDYARAQDGTNTVVAVPNSAPNGQPSKVVSSFGSGLKISARGTAVQNATYRGTFGTSGNLVLGGSNAGFIKQHVRALAIFPEQLSDASMIELTTL